MGKMVSLKMTAKEAKGEFGNQVASSPSPDLPKYPYGTRLTLETEALDKLGCEPSDFKVGQTLTITAKVEVIGTSTRERQGGKDRNEVDLQFTDISLDTKAIKKSKADDKHLNEIAGASDGGYAE